MESVAQLETPQEEPLSRPRRRKLIFARIDRIVNSENYMID